MHALLVGGAGQVGQHLAASLVQAPELTKITIAELDESRAAELASGWSGGAEVAVVRIDLNDVAALAQLASTSDCLVNCTPFPFFEKVLEAALSAGVDYLDFISEPTDDHRQRALDRGIMAIAGIGLSPGTSNVLCAHAAAQLDEIDEFHINFASFRTIAPSPGLLETILWELGAGCTTRHYFQNGRFVLAPPLEGSHRVTFPSPVGEQLVYFMPHPEATSLPRNFPNLRFAAVRGTWPPELMRDVSVLNKYGLLDDVPITDGTTTIFEAVRDRIWQVVGTERDSFPAWSTYITIEAIGRQGGERLRREYRVWHETWGTEAAGKTAGIHGAVAVRLVARHGRKPGVGFMDPETYFDPEEYLAEALNIPDVFITWEDAVLPDENASS